MIFAISDAVQIAFIAGITSAIPAMVVAWLGYLKSRKTEATVERTEKTVETVHTLVNSQMGEQLRIGMVSARTLAKVSPTNENERLSVEANKKYKEHQRKQAEADAKLAPTAPL